MADLCGDTVAIQNLGATTAFTMALMQSNFMIATVFHYEGNQAGRAGLPRMEFNGRRNRRFSFFLGISF
jgi:hypothetical protein